MPVPVARKLLQDSNRLVARAVATAEEATAAAAEGVNLLFLEVGCCIACPGLAREAHDHQTAPGPSAMWAHDGTPCEETIAPPVSLLWG